MKEQLCKLDTLDLQTNSMAAANKGLIAMRGFRFGKVSSSNYLRVRVKHFVFETRTAQALKTLAASSADHSNKKQTQTNDNFFML